MYRNCIFCNSDLGSNESVEEFPIGRRLAFDSSRGRLWVVCRICERWNLSPLEERWEAVEKMEKLYRDTSLRVSTEHIGLARLSEGTELVRIGRPERPEFAAWRYGDQFGRRRRRAFITAGAGAGAVGALALGGLASGVGISGIGWLLVKWANNAITGNPEEVVARIDLGRPEPAAIKRKQLSGIKLQSARDGSWRLLIDHEKRLHEFTGVTALEIGGKLLPAINRYGGTKVHVQSAVELLERAAGPLETYAAASEWSLKGKSELTKFPYPLRLALEMAAHEEQERRALEGELALLEAAWREAEEVAGIADRLLVPETVQSALDRIRGRIGI